MIVKKQIKLSDYKDCVLGNKDKIIDGIVGFRTKDLMNYTTIQSKEGLRTQIVSVYGMLLTVMLMVITLFKIFTNIIMINTILYLLCEINKTLLSVKNKNKKLTTNFIKMLKIYFIGLLSMKIMIE